MSFTREQLVERALKKLKVIGASQTASAPVTQTVDDIVDSVMASLAARQIFAWGDDDELPDEAFEHLADCLAYAAAGDFGKDNGGPAMKAQYERELRNLNLYSLSGQRQTAEYY